MLKSKNKLLHKALAFVLTFSLLATLVSFNFTASAAGGNYGGGSGTANDPYIIDDVTDLNTFASLVNSGTTNACAKLSDNFSVEAISGWTPIGNADNKFTGVFDGNGQTITINITDGDYVGLFGVNEGTIKNVTVAGNISSSTAKAFVGGVAGLNRGTIINCENSATIKTTGVNSYAGGIAGVMQNGTIESCKNSGNITVTVSDNVFSDVTDHEASAGGIVAFNYNGTVKKSTNTRNITNNDSHGYTGGIVGNNDGVIDNCLNNGTVTNSLAASYVGGIAGNLFTNTDTGSTAKISNSLTTSDNVTVFGSNGIEIKEKTKGIVSNCYYKNDTTTDETDGIKGVTQDELNNGTVTYMLNGNSSANPVWGQDLSTSENTLPIIGASDTDTVYKNGNDYSNKKPDNCPHNAYQNGTCPVCGDVIAKVSGHSVTLDGRTGLNFYFDIKEDISVANAIVTFTKNNSEVTANLTESKSTSETGPSVEEGFNRYFARIDIDSDQMNIPVYAELSGLTLDSTSITVKSDAYTIDKYLNSLSSMGDSKLKKLAIAMSTYGYYSNEYFGLYPSYEPSVPNSELTVTADTLSSYTLSYSGDDTSTTLKHYASSFQHLQTIAGVFYVQGKTDVNVPENTYMGYKIKLSDNKYLAGNENTYETEKVVSGATGYNWAVTTQIPVSQLRNATFEITFGTLNGDSYTVQSNTKTYSPYCYIKQVLTSYDATSIDYKLAQALYQYSEAAADYQ